MELVISGLALILAVLSLIGHVFDTPLEARKNRRKEKVRLLNIVISICEELGPMVVEYYTLPANPARDPMLEQEIDNIFNRLARTSNIYLPAYGELYTARFLNPTLELHRLTTGGAFRSKRVAVPQQARSISVALELVRGNAETQLADNEHPWRANIKL